MKQVIMTAVVLAAAVISGCASGSKDASASRPVNRMCPVMPEHDVPDSMAVTVVWKGKTVAFCCEDCAETWDKMSTAEKDRAVAAVRN